MRLPRSIRAVAILATALACALPATGCGGKKKRPGLTIEQLRDRALAEKTPERRARELVKVARLQTRSSDGGGASQTLSKARSLVAAQPAAADAPDAKPVDPAVAGPILVDIAEVYALVGERATAKDTLAQARRLLPAIDDPVIRCRMLAEAGGIYGAKSTGLADATSARGVLADAGALADEIEERFRPESLAAVATGYLAAGLSKEASATAESLEQLARSAADRPKAEALAVAATVRGRTGDATAAQALLDEAGAAARAIAGPENRAYALVSVARATGELGERQAALALLAEAEKSAGKVGDADAQKNAMDRVRAAQAALEKRK
jgi:hypothetical protein